MTFVVNGVDFMNTATGRPYIAFNGLKWQRNDIESPKAGRTMDGNMQRGRIGTKIRMDVTCRPLTASELQIVLNAIYPEYVTVQYNDPMSGLVTKTMYSNNNPATYLMLKPNGTEWWNGVTFPLVER
ncbi:MAG: hypothetical protein IJQ02_11850 [Oscillospiraceae bacterium]|nr:hypothetical protein [Oscillospiraceae bacterium]